MKFSRIIFMCFALFIGAMTVYGDTAISKNVVITASDEAALYAYTTRSLRTNELTTALWDTTNVSVTSTDSLVVNMTAFQAGVKPLLISVYSTQNTAVTYYGSGINALTGGDEVTSYLIADNPQNWRMAGLDSIKYKPEASATIHFFMRGITDTSP